MKEFVLSKEEIYNNIFVDKDFYLRKNENIKVNRIDLFEILNEESEKIKSNFLYYNNLLRIASYCKNISIYELELLFDLVEQIGGREGITRSLWNGIIRKYKTFKVPLSKIEENLDKLLDKKLKYRIVDGIEGNLTSFYYPRFEFFKACIFFYANYYEGDFNASFSRVREKINKLDNSFKIEIVSIPISWKVEDFFKSVSDYQRNDLIVDRNYRHLDFDFNDLKDNIENNYNFRRFVKHNLKHLYIKKYDYQYINYLIDNFFFDSHSLLLGRFISNKHYIFSELDKRNFDWKNIFKTRGLLDFTLRKEHRLRNKLMKSMGYCFNDQFKGEMVDYKFLDLSPSFEKDPLEYRNLKEISLKFFNKKGKKLEELFFKYGVEDIDYTQSYSFKVLPRRILSEVVKYDFKKKRIRYDLLILIVFLGQRGFSYDYCCSILLREIKPYTFSLIFESLEKLSNKQIIKFLNMMIEDEKIYKDRNFRDSINMLKEMDFCPSTLKFKNIKQIHDDLILLFNMYKFVKDDYELKQDLDLPDKLLGLKVVVPKTRSDLVLAGFSFSNCVGTYGELVKDKKCNVIFLYKKDKPYICIELQDYKVIQAKFKYNKSISMNMCSKLVFELNMFFFDKFKSEKI